MLASYVTVKSRHSSSLPFHRQSPLRVEERVGRCFDGTGWSTSTDFLLSKLHPKPNGSLLMPLTRSRQQHAFRLSLSFISTFLIFCRSNSYLILASCMLSLESGYLLDIYIIRTKEMYWCTARSVARLTWAILASQLGRQYISNILTIISKISVPREFGWAMPRTPSSVFQISSSKEKNPFHGRSKLKAGESDFCTTKPNKIILLAMAPLLQDDRIFHPNDRAP